MYVLPAVSDVLMTGFNLSTNTYLLKYIPLVCSFLLQVNAHMVDTLQLIHSCSGPMHTTASAHTLCSYAAKSA
jgi:hypothetical protein